MNRIDYTQLRCFKTVAEWSDVELAAKSLKMPPGAVNAQLRAFETALGRRLLESHPKGLVVTGFGRTVLAYAREIFDAEDRLLGYAAGSHNSEHEQFIVGLPDVIPKLVAHELLTPAFARSSDYQLVCREGSLEGLLAAMALHQVDLILSDCPASPNQDMPVHNQWLGECGVTIFGEPALAKRFRDGFPGSLNGAPMLLPALKTAARRKFDLWAVNHECRPKVVAEFDDTALLKVMGRSGFGLFPAPSAVAASVIRQYQVEALGDLEGVTEEYFAISLERRLRHPLVESIQNGVKQGLFAGSRKAWGDGSNPGDEKDADARHSPAES